MMASPAMTVPIDEIKCIIERQLALEVVSLPPAGSAAIHRCWVWGAGEPMTSDPHAIGCDCSLPIGFDIEGVVSCTGVAQVLFAWREPAIAIEVAPDGVRIARLSYALAVPGRRWIGRSLPKRCELMAAESWTVAHA